MYIVEAVVNAHESFTLKGFKSAKIYHKDCIDIFAVLQAIFDIVKNSDDVEEINVFKNKEYKNA